MIHVEGLNVSFGEKLVLDDIFLRVPSGRIGVVLGKNGAGKSVLLKAIAGLVPYQRGTVNVVSHPEKKEIPALGAPLAASTEPTVSTYGENQAGLAIIDTERHPVGSSPFGMGF